MSKRAFKKIAEGLKEALSVVKGETKLAIVCGRCGTLFAALDRVPRYVPSKGLCPKCGKTTKLRVTVI